MQIEQIKQLEDMCVNLELISVYDTACYSTQELIYLIKQKLNSVICTHNNDMQLVKVTLEKMIEGLKDLEGNVKDKVEEILLEFVEDGTLQEIINNEIFGDINTKIKSLTSRMDKQEKHIFVLRDRLTGETNDTQAFKDAVAQTQKHTTIYVPRDVVVTEKILLTDRNLDGGNHIFTCGTNGLDYQFNAVGIVDIKNCKVDSDLKGRGFITVNDSEMFTIENCSFTKYSKEFGYYKTDGAIVLNLNIKNAYINNCSFNNWGDQYGTTTADLNRCITVNDSTDNVNIENCKFITVNQGIVVDGGNVTITNCMFKDVKDNGLYLFSKNAVITNNIFEDMKDEVIVISKGDYIINSNIFNGWSNKAIAFGDNTESVIISNNKLYSDKDNSQFIVTRDNAYNIKKVFIDNNIFISDYSVENTNTWIPLGSCIELKFTNNNLVVNHTNSSKKIITTNATIAYLLNNSFTSKQASNTPTFENSKSDGTVIHENNYLSGCRMSVFNNKFGQVQSNVPYYLGLNENKFVYCSSKPTWDDSYFKKGDIAINTTKETDSKNGEILGWFHDGTQFNPIGTIPQTRDGQPNNNKRPRYIGDMCIDTSANDVYIATTTAINGWVKISKS
ncbi:MAG: right-handed parallel beta-helix repeat-containing protein [Cetobacterium sp.]